MALPRTAHEQTRRCARAWTDAQIAAQHLSPDCLARLLSRWSTRLRTAGITAVGASNGGTVPVRIDITRTPADAARDPRLNATDLNNQLRAVARLLWLSVLIAQPARVRTLGRIYRPDDCRLALHDVADLLRDPHLWCWVYQYGCELNWRWRETHDDDHAAVRILVQLDPWRRELPHIPRGNRRAA